jgi:hypothetical protein
MFSQSRNLTAPALEEDDLTLSVDILDQNGEHDGSATDEPARAKNDVIGLTRIWWEKRDLDRSNGPIARNRPKALG